MQSKLLLTEPEIEILQSLISCELKEVVTISWLFIDLIFDHKRIRIEPDDLPILSEKNIYADAVTLRITDISGTNLTKMQTETLEKQPGKITEIALLESLISSTNLKKRPKFEYNGAEIPEGYEYNIELFNPLEKKDNKYLNRTLLGIKFRTSETDGFTIYSNGKGLAVYYNKGTGSPLELKNNIEEIKLKNAP
jgi:hypothetical protein